MSTGNYYIRLDPAPSVSGSRAPRISGFKAYCPVILVAFGFLGATFFCGGFLEALHKQAAVTSNLEMQKHTDGPVFHGSFSELPGFEKFYMAKHNLKKNTSLSPASLFSADVCARQTSKDALYPTSSTFYHGTLVNFSGYPFPPSWFAAELPPANKLAMHVPMAWMCFGRGGYKVPGKYWLKEFVIKKAELLPEEVDAQSFYNSLGRQTEEAKEFCACTNERFGFIIDADAVDEQPEFIMCNPERDMQFVGEHVGDTSWDEDGKLILDVQDYGKYSLECNNIFGSFEVIRQPSPKAEKPDHPMVGPNCCSCCVHEDTCKGEASVFGSKCFSPKRGKLTRCNRLTRTFSKTFFACDS